MTSPTDISGLTPEWLTAALGRRVTAVTTEPVGTGQIGTVHRLRLTGEAVPEQLLAKLPATDPGVRAMLAGAYRQEVRFYTDIASTVAVRTPRCHHAEIHGDGAEFVLLLEDLAPARQGDQIAGCPVGHARSAVANLAGLHAPRWCDDTLLDIEGFSRNGPEEAATLRELYGPTTDIFLDRLGDRLTAQDHDILRACGEVIADWLTARPERFGLVHGDYRLDNLLFGTGTTPPATAVDWQTVNLGLPARDLAYFVTTSLDPEIRRTAEKGLVATYHQRLTELGVTGYTLEDCWQDYRFAVLQGPLVAVFGAAYGTASERGDTMFATMIRRSCAAIRDLDSLAQQPAPLRSPAPRPDPAE
ncbi:phosphotransferase [Nocardia jinanensis]|uniref:Aminoglycoside phosphotransferase n=1 Tax=Nocardia jinanensis TaxID=382504 RepID=A0A917RAS9_9NOCA|nr:phosphotransferase [Nocardia jinanensis]GGK97763.1 aminoglycoside phosphotransferase [Nocardia jinanensis]